MCFQEASIDRDLGCHRDDVVAETSNGCSNGTVATGRDAGVREGTPDPRNPSSEVLDGTRRMANRLSIGLMTGRS